MALRTSPLLVALGALLLSGCYADVESFAVGAAKQYCKRLRNCDRGAFEDLHDGDMGECRAKVEDDLLDTADALEAVGWEYDQDAGQECVAVRRDLRNDCSNDADRDINEACEDLLWDGF